MAKLLKEPGTMLYPVPAVMVSCGTGEQANIITLAWVGTLCSTPPMIGIGVRPSRHSHALIIELGEFVVNIPRADQLEGLDYCGNVSGADEDKWAACGFTQADASQVAVPLIAECPVNIECRVGQTLSLGSHDLFIGEVLAAHMDEDVLNERGHLDVSKARPFAYGRGEYWGIEGPLGTYGFSK